MKHLILTIAVALLNSLLAAHAGEAAPMKAHPKSKGWPSLFATDFSNAQVPPGVWSWKDGELTPKDKDAAPVVTTGVVLETLIKDYGVLPPGILEPTLPGQ